MPLRHALLAVVTVLCFAAPTYAQSSGAGGFNPWVATLIAIGLVVGVLVASFMGSKRGHQD